MDLFVLMFGKSKKKMRPILIDTKDRCLKYQKAREASKGTKAAAGWHQIVEAEKGARPWKQKTSTVGGNKDDGGRSGYISKNGFNAHT